MELSDRAIGPASNDAKTGVGTQSAKIVPIPISDVAKKRGKNGRVSRPTDAAQQNVAPSNASEPTAEVAESGRPTINVEQQLRSLLEVSSALLASTNEPPVLFRREKLLVTVDAGHRNRAAAIRVLTKDELLIRLCELADWLDDNSGPSRPPDILGRLLMHKLERLPELDTLATTPIFDAQGNLVAVPGYHRWSKVHYVNCHGLDIPAVNPLPTQEEVASALDLIENELLGDFTFATQTDMAHALAALLLPFCRLMIGDGCTPLHVFDAPTPGSGKNLLSDVMAVIATGHVVPRMVLDRSDDENRKTITALLLAGARVVLLDNLREDSTLVCPSLASVLTSRVWTGRYIGRSTMISAPNEASWMMTANNARLNRELARRSIRIRIAPNTDTPWLRTNFRHPNLLEWTLQNRSQLVHACLVLVQSWVAKGRPASPGTRLGSFERWSDVLGGILAAVGVEGFLATVADLHADETQNEWRSLVELWSAKYGVNRIRASELVPVASENELLGNVLGFGNKRSQASRLGYSLSRNEDRIVGNFRIRRDRSGTFNSARFFLEARGEM